jgi:hypothetical protein
MHVDLKDVRAAAPSLADQLEERPTEVLPLVSGGAGPRRVAGGSGTCWAAGACYTCAAVRVPATARGLCGRQVLPG